MNTGVLAGAGGAVLALAPCAAVPAVAVALRRRGTGGIGEAWGSTTLGL